MKLSDRKGQHEYRLGVFIYLLKMAEQKELHRFLEGLASEITNNVARGLQNIGESFTNQLAGLLTGISAQGVSQIVGSFDVEPAKYRDWIKSI